MPDIPWYFVISIEIQPYSGMSANGVRLSGSRRIRVSGDAFRGVSSCFGRRFRARLLNLVRCPKPPSWNNPLSAFKLFRKLFKPRNASSYIADVVQRSLNYCCTPLSPSLILASCPLYFVFRDCFAVPRLLNYFNSRRGFWFFLFCAKRNNVFVDYHCEKISSLYSVLIINFPE